MATELNFTKGDKAWAAEVVSTGTPMAVEVNRTEGGALLVQGSVDGLRKVPLHYFDRNTDRDILFEVDVPEGVRIHLTSYAEVEASKAEGV